MNFKRPKYYFISNNLTIITEDGNRKLGDRKIWFKPQKSIWIPLMKEIYLWVQLKSRVEENNYFWGEGKEYLRKFLNCAIDGMPYEKAKTIFDPNNKMK